ATTDLRAAEVLRLRAEAARFVPNMHSDLLQLVVEDAHQPTVPARPDAAGQVLRWHGVIGALDLDVAVAVDDSPCLVEAREAFHGQALQGRPFHVQEVRADLAAR